MTWAGPHTETSVDPQVLGETERLFRQILRLDALHIDEATSIFALGGSSLQAVTLSACLHTKFDVEITALSIVDHPTLAALTRHVTALRTRTAVEQDEEEGLL